MPRAPIRLAVSSYSSVNETSMSAGMSALTAGFEPGLPHRLAGLGRLALGQVEFPA